MHKIGPALSAFVEFLSRHPLPVGAVAVVVLFVAVVISCVCALLCARRCMLTERKSTEFRDELDSPPPGECRCCCLKIVMQAFVASGKTTTDWGCKTTGISLLGILRDEGVDSKRLICRPNISPVFAFFSIAYIMQAIWSLKLWNTTKSGAQFLLAFPTPNSGDESPRPPVIYARVRTSTCLRTTAVMYDDNTATERVLVTLVIVLTTSVFVVVICYFSSDIGYSYRLCIISLYLYPSVLFLSVCPFVLFFPLLVWAS